MRKLSLARLVGTAVLVPLLLVGCASAPDPQWTDGPAPTETAPVFSSNDEALAAATTAYGDYLAQAGEILAGGGDRPERIADFVTPVYFPELLGSFQNLSASGNSNDGVETIDRVSLIRYHDETAGIASVSIYLCADISQTRVLNEDGTDVTPLDRPKRIPLQIALISSRADPTRLLVAKEDVW